MEKSIKITSKKNENIKKIIKLKNKNKRDKYKLFLIEGYREISRAIDAKIQINSLFICRSLFLKDNENKLIDKIESQQVPVYACLEEIFKKISYRDRPDGLIAIAKQFDRQLSDLKKIIKNKENPFLIILEGIEKPGNLGTILRTATAANVDAVIIVDPITDIFNPNVVRASIGTLFTLPIFVSNNDEILKLLKENNIEIVATKPNSEIIYTNVDLKKPIALVFGTEQLGLSKFWIENSDKLVKIPMLGKIDSLNVAASTIVLIYEALRQRKFS